ncbi:tail fiber domain-containing protein [Ekhidna sp.]
MKKILTLALGIAIAIPMLAQLPQTLSFQGYLTSDAGEPITESSLSVSFALYTASSGGTLVWGPEPQTIEVDRGIFSTVLGTVEPLDIEANAPYFLQITIGSENLPRIAVTSGLYSLSTSNAANITANTLSIANGGTNADNTTDARTNLGLTIGTDVQGFDAGLNSIAGLTTVTDQMLYLTGSDAYATTSLTGFSRTLLDDIDASAAQATLGLSVGTNIQGFDAGLSSIAGLTTAANRMIYTDGADSYATTPLTGFARTLLDDTDEATFKSTVNLETGTDIQAFDAGLNSIAGLTTSTNQLIYTTASDVYATTSLTSFARTLLDDGNAATARSTLGLVIGTNVQAQDTDLADLADDGSLSGSRVSPVFGAQTITTTAGLHVGGTSNPGTDNAIVDGTLAVGVATPNSTMDVRHGTGTPSTGDGFTVSRSNTLKWSMAVFAGGALGLYSNNTYRGEFNSSTGAYSSTSDRRVKKNISSSSSVLPLLMNLPIMEYHFKTQLKDEPKKIGVIAQDVLPIFPHLVEFSKENNLYIVDYSGFGTLAIKAIQEQQKIIESLKTELEVTKRQLSDQKSSSEKLMSSLSEQEEKIHLLFELFNTSQKEETESKSTVISEKK